MKNIVGWAFILVSPAVGFTLPGPGGIPLFLIGFALVTFPGKRKLTARVLRGRVMDLQLKRFDIIEIAIAVVFSAVLFWPFEKRYWEQLNLRSLTTAFHITMALVVLSVMWVGTRFLLRCLNLLIRVMPRVRRKVRPWLRQKGIYLLPPRYRARRGSAGMSEPSASQVNDDILEIHERYRKGAISAWQKSWPWIRRGIGVAIAAWIIVIMFRPLRLYWPDVREQIHDLNWGRFAVASVMFALFLLLFRAVSWRRVLKGFGYKLPVWAAVRIWSTSEMARYLPGAIWQVLGRVYLIKPYGVNAVISSTSQILELCMFLFANVLIAGSCLLWYLAKISEHKTRLALITAICLMPTLAILLHPRIFYGVVNRILSRIGKPPIVKRLRGWKLTKLLGYMILGLVWQSLAVFLIAQPVLHLKIDWWWMVAAAYCLGWTAGFLAFWAPGGIAVREIIFATAMTVVMDPAHRPAELSNPALFSATVIFLGFVLRLWTLAGELMLWCASLL
ncbi:MAG TPA: lysylphosphatidylglycerol synthase domain-containing protein, partial [Bryobacteraceae bacterium]